MLLGIILCNIIKHNGDEFTSYHMPKAYFNSFCYFADKDVYVYIIILQLVYDYVGYQIKYKFVPFQIHLMI